MKKNRVINIMLTIIIILLFLLILEIFFNNSDEIIEKANIIISSVLKDESMENIEIKDYTLLDTPLRYYYDQLDDNSKIMYNIIEKNVENLKTGTYVIQLPDSIANVLNEENGKEKLNEEFQASWDALILDRVDIFYIDISKVNLKIKSTTYFNNIKYSLTIEHGDEGGYLEEGFNNANDINKAILELEEIKKDIISSLPNDTYKKIVKIHDWLIDNLDYGEKISKNNSYNIYGAFVNKNVVCEGYAEAFKYLMDEIRVPCILINGKATNSDGVTENHEWNYVKINEKWYGVDATWDDPIIRGGGKLTNSLRYKYFLKGSKVLNTNHNPDGVISTHGIAFQYPVLEEENIK